MALVLRNAGSSKAAPQTQPEGCATANVCIPFSLKDFKHNWQMLDQLLFVWELVYSQQLTITKDRLLFQNVEVKYKI